MRKPYQGDFPGGEVPEMMTPVRSGADSFYGMPPRGRAT